MSVCWVAFMCMHCWQMYSTKKGLEPPLKCNHFLCLAGWIKSWIILRWKMLFIFYSISHSEEGSLGLMNHVPLCKRSHALKPQGRIRFLITEVRFERFSVLGPASTLTEKSSKYCNLFIYVKGSYDAFLKILLCIWHNRICWQDLMFRKYIIFQIMYISVRPLCPASLKHFVFYKVPPSDKHSLLWLASWQCVVIGWTPSTSRKCNAPFHYCEL